MIQLVDRALEHFLRELVPLDESSVDVSFDTPDRTWGAGLTRPTINVYLWEVGNSLGHQKAGMEERKDTNGRLERRPANPVVELGYAVTTWAAQQKDEHQLLGAILQCVLRNPEFPPGMLPGSLSSGGRSQIGLAEPGQRIPNEFWSALDGRFKPALQVQVHLPIEVFAWQSTSTPVESVTIEHQQTERPPPAPIRAPGARAHDEARTLVRRRRPNGGVVLEPDPAPRRDEP